MSFPAETDLATTLHSVYRKWAGNMGLGDHLPETWNAIAEAAREALVPELLEANSEEVTSEQFYKISSE